MAPATKTSKPSKELSLVVVAGAGGDLGGRIAKALVARGAAVRALVRPGTSAAERAAIEALGVTVAAAAPDDRSALTEALSGAACVVSALNGLAPVILERQGMLLDAALDAGVPRFVPSDYAADFTTTRPGDNRNFDLRRAFMARVDAAAIRATSVLNGAFMDMLGAEMPLLQPRVHRVLYWDDADQKLDLTTKDDVAAFTAAVALDPAAPRFSRVAGDSVSARELAMLMTDVTGERYRPQWVGSLGMLGAMIALAKRFSSGASEVFPPWQGMQYMRDQFSGRGKLAAPLDNARYPDLHWTSARTYLTRRFATQVL